MWKDQIFGVLIGIQLTIALKIFDLLGLLSRLTLICSLNKSALLKLFAVVLNLVMQQVPDVEGLMKDKCQLTRTPTAFRFANKVYSLRLFAVAAFILS